MSPFLCFDEVGHLAAGVSHWQLGRFGLYRVNPPLVRTVAAMPAPVAGPAADWNGYAKPVGERSDKRTPKFPRQKSSYDFEKNA